MEGQGKEDSVQNQGVGFPGSPAPLQNQSNKKNWKWLIVLVLFLIVIGGVTFFVFKNSKSGTLEESPTPEETTLSNFATPQETPTPIPSPSDKKELKIKILNGTGVAGDAGYLSDILKNLGYVNIQTGNADTQDANADTEVIFASQVSNDVTTQITQKLKDLYANVKVSNGSLTGADIQITTGLKKSTQNSQSESPTATPTATPSQ